MLGVAVDTGLAPPEPTQGEKANGWTAESLAGYLAERRNQQIVYATRKRPRRIVVEDYDGFNPFKW